MPWSAKDASSKTKAADTPAKKVTWRTVANDILVKGGSEGKAIRVANSVVKGKK